MNSLIPILLNAVLTILWSDRKDWFFGIGIGIYRNDPDRVEQTPLVPDAFLSIGVERLKTTGERLNYAIAAENNIVPQLVLDVVSPQDLDKHKGQQQQYEKLGVLYYVLFDPECSRGNDSDSLEVYRLVEGKYVRQTPRNIPRTRQGDKSFVWLPEIGLGMGCDRGVFQSWQRDWLYWYDEKGDRHPLPEELLQRQRERLDRQQKQLAELNAKLIALGIDPQQY
ncbi:MAG: Uma2 family endonuclease [Cyanobacteriota bacterium]|nr:Uma2 family endonuclease [Cyanobacteriota bacterium]